MTHIFTSYHHPSFTITDGPMSPSVMNWTTEASRSLWVEYRFPEGLAVSIRCDTNFGKELIGIINDRCVFGATIALDHDGSVMDGEYRLSVCTMTRDTSTVSENELGDMLTRYADISIPKVFENQSEATYDIACTIEDPDGKDVDSMFMKPTLQFKTPASKLDAVIDGLGKEGGDPSALKFRIKFFMSPAYLLASGAAKPVAQQSGTVAGINRDVLSPDETMETSIAHKKMGPNKLTFFSTVRDLKGFPRLGLDTYVNLALVRVNTACQDLDSVLKFYGGNRFSWCIDVSDFRKKCLPGTDKIHIVRLSIPDTPTLANLVFDHLYEDPLNCDNLLLIVTERVRADFAGMVLTHDNT